MIEMLWVQIPAPCTGWNLRFFTLICCKNCIEDCLKRPKINRKEARVGPFKKSIKMKTKIYSSFIQKLVPNGKNFCI